MSRPLNAAAIASALVLLATSTLSSQKRHDPGARPPFSVIEASIVDIRAALDERRISSRQLVEQYLAQIALHEDTLNAVIAVNPRALEEASARDREREQSRIRGALHGVPIALKDNILTTDLATTGGALAFDRFMPPYEATLVRNLRNAGAIIFAKTGLTELANWVANGMPGNYTAIAGFAMNPYDPRRDPREATFDGRPALSTGGSSSGAGTAANFWTASIGTDTSGSIVSPANQTMLAALRPTIGRISRHGVIPITLDQDTAGPMARSVTDVALLLGTLEGASPDPNDPATKTCTPAPNRDYLRFLDRGALKSARIGIPRAFFYDAIAVPGGKEPRGGLTADQAKAMREAIGVITEQGATVVDPADIPSVVVTDRGENFVLWPLCSGLEDAKGRDADCTVVLKYGMKRDFNTWLATLGPSAPVKTLTELRQWNIAHQRAGAIKYGQARLDISDEMDLEADRDRYEADRKRDLRMAGANGIDAAMAAHKLDALLFPGSSGAALAARPGYPIVIVPFAMVPNAPDPGFPRGFDAKPSPFGVSFVGGACSEARLLAIAYAFEQATRRRVRPPMPQ